MPQKEPPTDVYSAVSLLKPAWAAASDQRIKMLEEQIAAMAKAAEEAAEAQVLLPLCAWEHEWS